MTSFGERFREWRKKKGVTSYAIEKGAKIDRSNLRQIEKGERPASDDVLRRLADIPALEISFETLKVWQRFENATYEEKLEALAQLTSENDLLPMVRQLIEETSRGMPPKHRD